MKVVHVKHDDFSHYIGRNATHYGYHDRDTGLGNPFGVGQLDTRRNAAIEAFEAYARSTPEVLAKIKALPHNAVLGCWCKPKQCHGDVIVKLWKEMHNVE